MTCCLEPTCFFKVARAVKLFPAPLANFREYLLRKFSPFNIITTAVSYTEIAAANRAKYACSYLCTQLLHTFKFTCITRLVFLLVFWPYKFNNCFAFRMRWC